MLDRIIWWLGIVSTALDGMLLLRVVTLRLFRTYTFVTLYCALNFLLDISVWVSGLNSPGAARIFVYSRFLWAIVFPLAAWDIFEEHTPPVAAVRRLQARRLISGLVMAPIFALIFSLGVEDTDAGVVSTVALYFAFFLWFSTALACFLFVLAVFRLCRRENIAVTGNTFVWMVFFGVSFLREMIDCFVLNIEHWVGSPAVNAINIGLSCLDIALSAWCILRLRGIRSNEPAPQNASI